jgi:hypothetical protein
VDKPFVRKLTLIEYSNVPQFATASAIATALLPDIGECVNSADATGKNNHACKTAKVTGHPSDSVGGPSWLLQTVNCIVRHKCHEPR